MLEGYGLISYLEPQSAYKSNLHFMCPLHFTPCSITVAGIVVRSEHRFLDCIFHLCRGQHRARPGVDFDS